MKKLRQEKKKIDSLASRRVNARGLSRPRRSAPAGSVADLKIVSDSIEAAEEAGLRYVSDDQPGYTRKAKGDDFDYFDTEGKLIRDEQRLLRIKRLAIPPAWKDVWISPSTNGHIQATGRDARKRKQYIYHERWREMRDENKYERIVSFGKALPKIRRRVSKDLSLPELPRNKVLAAIVQLLELSFIRVGNEEYARENKSFGLTTMQDRHVDVKGSKMRRRFYRQRFSDLGGAVLAAIALNAVGEFETKKQAKANIKNAVIAVAKTLRNTPAICRKCYVHPAVFENYLAGNSIEGLKRETDEALGNKDVDLRSGEVAILKFLQARLARKAA